MSDIAIKVEGLSKRYLVGHQAEKQKYVALRDVIARNAASLARKTVDMIKGRPIVQGDEVEEFWALKDIDFEIRQGEWIGLVGRNGAGKSTLLKILSRITDPTSGRIEIFGRLASLLEVGTGFHPELSGRENIYLNAAILGMRKNELLRKFDAIVDFSEVEKFLDTPVKHYSSGMYVKLAFAVAAFLEPEILVVDEVLAVGDLGFQKKCRHKMAELVSNGCTTILVSHHIPSLLQFANKGLGLEQGKIFAVGEIQDVVRDYIYLLEGESQRSEWVGEEGDKTLTLKKISVSPVKNDFYLTNEPITLIFDVDLHEGVQDLIAAFNITNAYGTILSYSAYHDQITSQDSLVFEPGNYVFKVVIPPNTLAEGSYKITADFGIHNIKQIISVASVEVKFINIDGLGIKLKAEGNKFENIFRCDWHWDVLFKAQ